MGKSQPDNSSISGPTASKSGSRTPKTLSTRTSLIPTPSKRPVHLAEVPATLPATMSTKLQELSKEIQNCSWDELQIRFADAMHERSEFESALQKETAELLEVFIVWSQTTGFHDEDRAYKRFKTRMDYVQNCEANLEEKKRHYANVVKAFESALALLRDE
ncbi:hypothetical protein VTO42DRAFT_6612 [Malbranchea cinnamomea]